MTNVKIRPALTTDLPRCLAVDPSYTTDYVWQMDSRANAHDGQINVAFRSVKLPRSMRVAYPHDGATLQASWKTYNAILIADDVNGLVGYATLIKRALQSTVWINDLIVTKAARRTGVGSALLKSAAQWGHDQQLKWLIVEVQTKNYPAISFCQKHGMAFCGFNDRYFANQDIALFFALALH